MAFLPIDRFPHQAKIEVQKTPADPLIQRGRYPIRYMADFWRAMKRALLEDWPHQCMPRPLGMDDFGKRTGWLSGRLHGTILALIHDVPVVACESGTKGVRAMLGDMGLSDRSICDEQLAKVSQSRQPADHLGPMLAYSQSDWQSVARYRRQAAAHITKLFDDIATELKVGGQTNRPLNVERRRRRVF